MISEKVFALIVMAHSTLISQGDSISTYFSISVDLVIRLSIDAFRYMFCKIGNVAFLATNLLLISTILFNFATSISIFIVNLFN